MTASLSIAESGAFVLRTREAALAEAVRVKHGWADATKRDGLALKPGEHLLWTRCEYAALALDQFADARARDTLFLRALEYEESYATDGPEVPSPPGMEFMPFQRGGVHYAARRAHALIGDPMGLGKTAQAVGLANLTEAQSILVVCPASVRLQWRAEIMAWTTMRRPSVYPILRSADGVHPKAAWTVVSYDLARREGIFDALMRRRYDLLVLDEAHYLKSVDTQRTRKTLGDLLGMEEPLASRAKRVLALTGTPLPNRPRECYTMARHLCWDAIDWQSEEAFKRRYNPSMQIGKHVVEEVGRLPELRARLRCNFMVRRRKPEVLPQLPRVRYELTYVEPNGEIRKALKAESLLHVDPDHLEEMDMETRGHIAVVRRQMGVAKVPRVVERVTGTLDGGVEKIVLVAYHRDVMGLLMEKLKRYGIVCIRGGMTPMAKERARRRFIDDPDCAIILLQIEAGGIGLDGLQKVCDLMMLAEASWSPKDNDQVVGRLDRMGQKSSPLAQFLVAPGSLDERILGKAIAKLRNIHETLDGGE